MGIDSNADRNPNYFIDVFFAAGRFRGVLFKPNGSVITYYLKAARVSPKAVKVTLPHSQIIQKGSYDFLIFLGVLRGAVHEQEPVRRRHPGTATRLIRHDFTPTDSFSWGSVPTLSERCVRDRHVSRLLQRDGRHLWVRSERAGPSRRKVGRNVHVG